MFDPFRPYSFLKPIILGATLALLGVFGIGSVVLLFQVSAAVTHFDKASQRTLDTLSASVRDTTGDITRDVHRSLTGGCFDDVPVQSIVSGESVTQGDTVSHGFPPSRTMSYGTLCNGLNDEVAATLAQARSTMESLQRPVDQLTRSIALVNASCEPGPCGTLADVNKTLGTARGTMGQIEIAAHHENRNLDKLDGQEDQLFADVHSTIENANVDLMALNNTVLDARDLLRNPAIPTILANTATASATTDHMLLTFDQVETKATHSYLHPSHNPFVRSWQYVSPFLLPAAQISAAVK